MTLLNGEQAQCAIKDLHQHVLREKEISVQLQPTDALLCIANLPRAFTQQQFEELVRPFGNLERCFLVYSATTGLSKGYGFVEYMKKDSAARAKSELLGKQLGSRMLYVHWTEVGSLTYPLLHSKCLCVDRLPPSLLTAQDLRGALAETHTPSFCQVKIHHTFQTLVFLHPKWWMNLHELICQSRFVSGTITYCLNFGSFVVWKLNRGKCFTVYLVFPLLHKASIALREYCWLLWRQSPDVLRWCNSAVFSGMRETFSLAKHGSPMFLIAGKAVIHFFFVLNFLALTKLCKAAWYNDMRHLKTDKMRFNISRLIQ